jgi:hypothetical protein
MPAYLVEAVEHRTYEIEADSEQAAIERVSGEPEDLPIGSLVSVDRRAPVIARSGDGESEEQPPGYADATGVLPSELDRTPLNQPSG